MDINYIKDLISKSYEISTITLTENTRLQDLGLDSLDVGELVMRLEEEHNISLDDINGHNTVGDLLKYINKSN